MRRAWAVTLLPFFLSSFLSLSNSSSGMMDLPTWNAFDAWRNLDSVELRHTEIYARVSTGVSCAKQVGCKQVANRHHYKRPLDHHNVGLKDSRLLLVLMQKAWRKHNCKPDSPCLQAALLAQVDMARAAKSAPEDWHLAALPKQLLLQVVELLVAHDGHLVEVERLRSSAEQLRSSPNPGVHNA